MGPGGPGWDPDGTRWDPVGPGGTRWDPGGIRVGPGGPQDTMLHSVPCLMILLVFVATVINMEAHFSFNAQHPVWVGRFATASREKNLIWREGVHCTFSSMWGIPPRTAKQIPACKQLMLSSRMTKQGIVSDH